MLLTGCNLPGTTTTGTPSGAVVPKPKFPSPSQEGGQGGVVREKGFVSLTRLAQAHPLQADVARLRTLEAWLARVQTPVIAPEKSAYQLPVLLFQPIPLGREIQQEAGLRLALRRRATRQVNEVAHGLRVRQQKVLDERRMELDAIYAAEEAETVRVARGAIADRARQRLEETALYATNLTIKRQAVENDLRILPPIYDRAVVEREIETLRQDKKTYGISDRARLELSLREIAAKKADLDARNALIRQNAIDAVAAARRDARAKRDAEVAAQLGKIKRDTDIAALVREQSAALRSLAAQSLGGISRTIVTPGGASGIYTIAAPGLSEGRVAAGGETVTRLAAQRRELERFIQADVADAVREIAEQHAIDVTFGGDDPSEGVRSGGNGRQDMTSRFAVWMREKATFRGAAPRSAGKGSRT